MPEPLTPERLAELRQKAEWWLVHGKNSYGSALHDAGKDILALLDTIDAQAAVISRLRGSAKETL